MMTLSVDKLSVLIFTQPIFFTIVIHLLLSGDDRLQTTALLLIVLDIPLFMSSLTSSEYSHQLYQAAILEKKINAAKTDFLSKMTHELRTPMNTVVGIGHLLEKTELSESQTNYIKNLQYASNSLLGIIDDILDFSRIEAGQFELEHTPFKLSEITETLYALIETQAQKKSLSLKILVDDTTKALALTGDSLRLIQVLTNLAINGIKFTQYGGVTISIEQSNADKHRVQLTFKVSDTGIGIRNQDKDLIFKSFTQLNATNFDQHSGTGLGLAISQNLVEMMGGKIHIDSIAGQSSTFYFSIWFDYAKEDQVYGKIATKKNSTSSLEKIPALENKLVLVVDDNDLNLMVGQAILELFGLKILTASSAQQAFKIMKNTLPDLILMDLQMPEINGYEAFDIIQNNPDWQEVPIIALTADASITENKKALNYGMNDFLTKPFNFEKMKQALTKSIVYSENKPKHSPQKEASAS